MFAGRNMSYPHKILVGYITVVMIVISNVLRVTSLEDYKLQELCGTDMFMILEDTHQVKVTLDDYGGARSRGTTRICEVRIEGWYTWPRLMFYFEDLHLNCSDGYLMFYDGATGDSSVKGLDQPVCGLTKPTGLFTAGTSSMLRVKYVAYTNAVNLDIFSVIVTAFSTDDDHECPSTAFKCDNGRCIVPDIRCNGYDSCGDNSGCRVDVSSVAVAGIVVGSLAGLGVLVTICVITVCCVRQKNTKGKRHERQFGVVYTVGDRMGPQSENPPSHQHVLREYSEYFNVSITAGQKPAYPPNWAPPTSNNYATWASNDINTCISENDINIAKDAMNIAADGGNITGDAINTTDDDIDIIEDNISIVEDVNITEDGIKITEEDTINVENDLNITENTTNIAK